MQKENPFEIYQAEVRESITHILEKIEREKNRDRISISDYPIEKLRKKVVDAVAQLANISAVDLKQINLELPPECIEDDLALSTFPIIKKVGENPQMFAIKIADVINQSADDSILEARTIGPFVNFQLNREKIYQDILSTVTQLGKQYGESDLHAGNVALIDYSAPNIAKPIGVGHLRSTIIGQALANIYRSTGYVVIRDNHLGDWGTQFGALIYAYDSWGDEEKIAKNPLQELKKLYVKFHYEVKKNPELQEKARELFQKLESKDQRMVALWKKFRDLSIQGFQEVYDRLGIEFDTYIGESYFADEAKKIANLCVQKGIARKEDKTPLVVVDSIKGVPSFLLKKQDGTTLYLTRDLATLQFRIKTLHSDSILYVVGKEQELHFNQLFEVGKAAEIIDSQTETKHIGFGLVLSGGKKMSTRRGTLIELEDLFDEAVKKSKSIIIQKNPSLKQEEVDAISEIVGVGAIIYNDLKQSRVKDISFDWDRMLNFESGSAAYLQYTCVRISSILKQIKEKETSSKNMGDFQFQFMHPTEFQIAKKLMFYPLVISRAQQSDSPHVVCTYLEELAQLFNNFYKEISVIKTEKSDLRNSRVLLIKGVRNVIQGGLNLLNIKVPDRM